MIECVNCKSSNFKIIDYFDDRDNYIDAELECLDCNETHTYTLDSEELEELEKNE